MKYGKVLSMSIADENFGSCHQEVSSVKALLESGAPKGQTEKGSYSLRKITAVLVQTGLFLRVPVFSCLVGRLTFTSHGPHISMERFWQMIVVAACNSDWRHGPFWYSTGGLQRQDVRQLSGLNLGPGNPNTRQIKHDKKQLSRCFNWF